MSRVWDRFLTEQDKAHLAANGSRARWGFGERPALLSIDNYRDAVGDEPQPLLESIKSYPGSTGLAGWRALDQVAQLLSAARDARIPVVHLTALTEEDSAISSWARPRGHGAGHAAPGGAATTAPPRNFHFVDQAMPIPGEAVIPKAAPSGFFGTPLLAHLNALRIDTLILCGESTSGCVRATAVDGRSYRYRVIVVEDAVYDRHEACHALSLFDLDQKYADVLTLSEVEAQLAGASRRHSPTG